MSIDFVVSRDLSIQIYSTSLDLDVMGCYKYSISSFYHFIEEVQSSRLLETMIRCEMKDHGILIGSLVVFF